MVTDSFQEVAAKAQCLDDGCLGIARLPKSQLAIRVSESKYVAALATLKDDETKTIKTDVVPKFTS